MRLSPRLLATLALGGSLLAFPSADPISFAETNQETSPETTSPPNADTTPAKPSPSASSPYNMMPARETDQERAFIELANQERARRGLSQLQIDPVLTTVARLHSAEMRDRNYFNHESPVATLRTPLDRYLQVLNTRPAYACVGENLYYSTAADVRRGHQAFMNSPTHRDNVLFSRFEKIGVGIVRNERGEFWVTQMFLTNRDPGPTSVANARQK